MAEACVEMDEPVHQELSNESCGDAETRAKRLPKLQDALDKMTHKCVKSISYSMFAKSFDFKTKEGKMALKLTHKQFQEQLETNIKKEIEMMLEEEKIPEKLSQLDVLTNKYKGIPAVAWRPTGVPDDDVAAHLISSLTIEREKLEAIASEAEATKERLAHAVCERRRGVANKYKLAKEKSLQQQQEYEKFDKSLDVFDKFVASVGNK